MATRFVLVLFLLLLGASANAQQNFFNVPSTDITFDKKIFIQEQLNINQITQSNLTLDYGLGRGFQIGINILGIDLFDIGQQFKANQVNDRDIFEPLFLINAQKTFRLNNYFSIAAGTNQGINLDVFTEKVKYAQFDYLNTGTTLFKENILLVAGGYYGNGEYFEKTESFGFIAGADVNLYKQKLHFTGDWISGNTPASVAVLGLSYFIIPGLPVSLGWQFPNTRNNSAAVVLEITWNPSSIKHNVKP